MSFSQGSVNKIYNSQTETFKRSFKLTHNGDSIFGKTFDGSDSDTVLLGSDSFVINNHFYVTGEPLDYDPGSGNSPIEIDPTSTGVGGTTLLPSQVYAIKVSENRFKVSAAQTLAYEEDAIVLSNVGVGTSHIFRAQKENTKCLILIDNIIQSPIHGRVGTGATGTSLVSISDRSVTVSDASIFKNYDLIKINDEIMRIVVTGYNNTENLLLVDRGYLGTTRVGTHAASDFVQYVKGDYNIIGDEINFADTPFGGFKLTIGISSSNVNISTNSLTILTDSLSTGDRVRFADNDLPSPLESNRNYFLIKNSSNNFSIANSFLDSTTNTPIVLTSAGIGTHQLTYVDDINGSSFQGRAFIRSRYDGNILIDDLSQEFTGIAKTFTITSSGFNTTGITSDFGAILINNIFQKPNIDYEFIGGSDTGITSIRFSGTSDRSPESYSLIDVNANKLPRKGLIVSIANSEGFGYQRRAVGTGTAVVSGFGTITVALGFTGTGYRNGPTTYGIKVLGGNPTTAAAGTFTVDAGHIQDVFMNTPGVGYTWTNVPKIQIDDPVPYDDIQLISQSTGIGASVSIDVGIGLSISSFTLNSIGYGFTANEKLTIAGIPTVTSIGSTFQNAIFTVKETSDDDFSGWVFGKLQILDDFSSDFNGSKKTFTLTKNNVPISIEKTFGSPINLENVLLIFINDVLQKPGVSYTFDGGTQLTFKEAPVSGSSLQILFYRGTDADISNETALATIKPGDSIQILRNNASVIPVQQNDRIVKSIISRDTIETNVYKGPGITAQTSPLRPVVWCKQQNDIFLNGVKISKSRPEYGTEVYPSTRLISDISTTSSSFYASGGSLGFSKTENPDDTDFGVKIIDTINEVGFGTTTFIIPVKKINSGVSLVGDEGIITGVGFSANALQFEFYIPLNSPLRENDFGGISKTGIATGDYFIVSNSSIENGASSGPFALSQNRSTVIGTCTQFFDGVYQVSSIEPVGVNTMRIHTNVQSGHNFNSGFAGLSSGIGYNYGEYSWAKFTVGSAVGLAFTCNRGEGLSGISTAPQIIRVEKLSIDYS